MFDQNQRIEKTMTIIGASQYDFKSDEGQHLQGCKLTAAVPADVTRGNKLGFDVIKVPADFEIFKLLGDKGVKFPTDLLCTVESRASGDKITDHIISVKAPAASSQKSS